MTRTEAKEELLDERNGNISDWIGKMPSDYWFKVAVTERVARREAEAKLKLDNGELLDAYSRYLEERSFIDSDWYTEGNTVLEFLEGKK